MDEAMVSYARECIAYLHRQIDPRDRGNPKYALLHKQIEAIHLALADATATEIPPIILPEGAVQLSDV